MAVFFLIDAASLGGVYLKLQSDATNDLHSAVQSEIESLDLTATPRALSAIVSARARASDAADTVIVLVRADGGQVGNARATMEGGEIRLEPLADSALSQDGYVQDIRRLSGGVLILGLSMTPLRELTETFVTLFLLSFVPTAVVSIFAGAYFARRAAGRVARIEEALALLSSGDLSVRIPAPFGSDDLARIADGVNRLAERQEAATEQLRQVTTDIAHDLKTPIQRASVLLHDLELTFSEGSDGARLAGAAAEEIDRASNIFAAMLRIAQIEGGPRSAEFRPVDLCDTVREIAELYRPVVEEAGDILSLDLPSNGIVVQGNAGLLGQALSNLIENAIRHTPRGSTIAISVTDGPILAVADNGPGIPPAEREKVVRRFYRLERSRTSSGHGLGLALVAAIVNRHGARLTFGDNNPGTRAAIRF
ncbi:MAG: ATP-binding protein [Pseudomonadota bacterium]|nr:ATP-binding protein [Pseudomonadota bacterium]